MSRLLYTLQAEEDLLEIWSFIAEDDMTAADHVLEQMGSMCRNIADVPFMGRDRSDVAENLRGIAMGSYVVFYRPIEDGIVIIRVLHGARDLPELF